MNVKELNDLWVAAGQKVADLNAEVHTMLVDDAVEPEALVAKQKELDVAKAKREMALKQYEDAKAIEVTEIKEKVPLNNDEKEMKAKFISDFKGMINGDSEVKALIDSNIDSNGDGIGLTIPQDIQTLINRLKRQFNALEQYVRVIKVGTLSGSRNMEKWSDATPMQNLDDEDDVINEGDAPQVTIVKYLIQRYGTINTLSNSLLKDTAENILDYIVEFVAKKSTTTRNVKIIATLDKLPAGQKKTITKMDELKTIFNVDLDPAIQTTSSYTTNQSGFNALDLMKKANGEYLLQPDPTNPTKKLLNGKALEVVSDKNLKDTGKKHPLYIGDLEEAVVLWDREQLSLATTTEGAGAFERDQTKLRAIDRFDVTLWDEEAVVFALFEKLEDETPVTPPTGP